MNALDKALALAAKGYYVFPVRVTIAPDGSNTKAYPTRWAHGGPGQAATTDAAVIRDWFALDYADCMVGIATGPSGIVVADLDTKHGQDGPSEWAKLAEPYPLPAAVGHTSTGGKHLTYRADPDHPVRTTAGQVAPGVDTRGIGGMVVAWADWWPRITELPPVPAVVIERAPYVASSTPLPTPSGQGDPFASVAKVFTRAEAREFCLPHIEALASAPNGRINDTLNIAAKVVYHFVPNLLERDQADAWVLEALAKTAYDGATWKARATLDSAWAASRRDWIAELGGAPDPLAPPAGDEPDGGGQRIVDLAPYLDGSYIPPAPRIGLERDDGKHLLYPGRWHTVMALTAAGKSWLALWHALEEIRRGHRVVYGHFEEGQPSGTISRLLQLGATVEEIGKLFTWVDCTRTWHSGEFAATMAGLETAPVLVILDGINAACSQHGWPVNDPIAVGSYRAMFVTPAAATGAAVLSLGHPPKARDRQGERHGFGSTAWLDEVDGVGFRMRAGKDPIGRGRTGHSALFTVKDRYGQVEALGRPDGDEDGWYYVGSFHIDDSPGRRNTVARLSAPKTGDEGRSLDSVDLLALSVVRHLEQTGLGTFSSVRSLSDAMRARKIKFTASELPVALELLARQDRIDWPEVAGDRKPRPGSLIVEAVRCVS